jgi:ribosomal protein L29
MSDFKNTTEKDLMKMVADKRKAVQAFRFGSSGSKTRNVKEGLNTRKEIARMLTELNSRKNK